MNGAEASWPWKLLRTYLASDSCASIGQAVVCRPPCLLSRQSRSPDAVRSRNPSKSTRAHDAVTAAVSHKHHSFRVGAGLIQFVYGSHSLGRGAHFIKNSVFAIFSRQFQSLMNGLVTTPCWQEASKFLKHLFFWGNSTTKKIAKPPRKCNLHRAANFIFSKEIFRKKNPRSGAQFLGLHAVSSPRGHGSLKPRTVWIDQ